MKFTCCKMPYIGLINTWMIHTLTLYYGLLTGGVYHHHTTCGTISVGSLPYITIVTLESMSLYHHFL